MAAVPLAWGLATRSIEGVLLSTLAVSVLALAALAHDVVQLLTIPRTAWPERPTWLPGSSPLRLVQLPARQQWIAALAGLGVYASLALGAFLAELVLERLQIQLIGVAEVARILIAVALMQLLPVYPFDGGFLFEAALRQSVAAPLAAELVGSISYPFAIAVGLLGVLGQPVLVALGAWIWLATTARREAFWASPACLVQLLEDWWRSERLPAAFARPGAVFSWSRTTIIQL